MTRPRLPWMQPDVPVAQRAAGCIEGSDKEGSAPCATVSPTAPSGHHVPPCAARRDLLSGCAQPFVTPHPDSSPGECDLPKGCAEPDASGSHSSNGAAPETYPGLPGAARREV